GVAAQHPGAAAGELEAVEAGVAADVEHRPAAQVHRDGGCDLVLLEAWKIAQRMIRSGFETSRQVQVVEPGAEGADLPGERVVARRACRFERLQAHQTASLATLASLLPRAAPAVTATAQR